jgi:hypothetical protein
MQYISTGHLGQFFTPEPVADLMAQVNIDENGQPGQKVLDPACGSGRCLLSAARINRHLLFYGADLDVNCCKMALINMLFNSLTGEIAHMNSLTNEFYRGYRFQTKLVEDHHYPYFVEFTDPFESYIWLHPTAKSKGPSTDSPLPAENPITIVSHPLTKEKMTQGSLF